jgi:hypothetical protein
MKLNEAKKMQRELSEREFKEDCFCIPELTEDINTIIESDNFEVACGQELLPKDLVDQAIWRKINRVIDAGYADGDAEEAVFEATSRLINSGELSDTPPLHESDDVKMIWIQKYEEKIYAILEELGIEFD